MVRLHSPKITLRFIALLITALVAMSACAGNRSLPRDATDLRELATTIASFQTDAPYRYGSAGPDGFDCSGLVYFSYEKAGLRVPRATTELKRFAARVSNRNIERGDLLFFDERGRRASHVGIYLGDGWFVHAPSSGQRVRVDRLETPYWQDSYAFAARVAANR
jgi:cell wall-associated NlpC family hydrolase